MKEQRTIIEGELNIEEEITTPEGVFCELTALASIPESTVYLQTESGIRLRLRKRQYKAVHTMGTEPREFNTSVFLPRPLVEGVAKYIQNIIPRLVWLEDERVFKREVPISSDPAQKLIEKYSSFFLEEEGDFEKVWERLTRPW